MCTCNDIAVSKLVRINFQSTDDHSLEDDCEVDFVSCNDDVSLAFTRLFSTFQKALNDLNEDDFCFIRNACVVQAKEPLCSALKHASDSCSLFRAFSQNDVYFNWMHLSFLDIIANSYVDDSLVNIIKDYKQIVFSKSLRKVWRFLPHSVVRVLYYTELKEKLGDRDPDNMTVEQLLHSQPQLTKKIARLVAVVQEDGLLISWLIPTDEVYQSYLSFLTVPQQFRKDDFVQFGNWMAHAPQFVVQEEKKIVG